MAHLPNLQAWTNGFLKFPELQNKPTGNRNPQWNTASPSALPCIQSQTTVCIDQDSSRTVRSGESTTFVANGRPKICVAAEQKLILTLKTTFRIEIFKNLSLHMFTFAGLTSSNPTSVMVPGQKQTIASLSSHYIHGCVVLRSRGNNKGSYISRQRSSLCQESLGICSELCLCLTLYFDLTDGHAGWALSGGKKHSSRHMHRCCAHAQKHGTSMN